MKQNQIRQVVLHTLPRAEDPGVQTVGSFHVQMMERQLEKLELPPQEKLAVLAQVKRKMENACE